MFKKMLYATLALGMVLSFDAAAMQNQQSLEYNKRIMWALGSTLGMGLVSKVFKSPVGSRLGAHVNYTSQEIDFVTSVSACLSMMRIVDDSPMTRRWTAALCLTMVAHKIWSSYWMQDLLNLGAGALGQSIFPQEDIAKNKKEYETFNEYSYELKFSNPSDIKEYDKKQAFVDNYSYRKRSSLATAVMTVATVTPMLELFYHFIQTYGNVPMGVKA